MKVGCVSEREGAGQAAPFPRGAPTCLPRASVLLQTTFPLLSQRCFSFSLPSPTFLALPGPISFSETVFFHSYKVKQECSRHFKDTP